MKIYIFSCEWAYCGGMAVATGNSFAEASENLREEMVKTGILRQGVALSNDAYKYSIVENDAPINDHNFTIRCIKVLDLKGNQSPYAAIEFNYG